MPNALTFNAHLERVLVERFKHNTDLLAEKNKMVQQEKVRNALILSGFGSYEITRFTRSGIASFLPRTSSLRSYRAR